MKTLTALIIKPNATTAHKTGEILAMVEKAGFEILELRLFTMTRPFAEVFYEMHHGREFFERLVAFMTSGHSVAAALAHDDAVHALRELVGSTDPTQAAPGTIRQLYGQTVTINAVHASDSHENALREISILFPETHLPLDR